MFSRTGLPDGRRYTVDGRKQCRPSIVIQRDNGDRERRLFACKALVGSEQYRKAIPARAGKQFIVAQCVPIAEHGSFDCCSIERFLEGPTKARGHPVIEKHLHLRSGAGVGPLFFANDGIGAKRSARGAQHRGGGVPVNLKFADEVVQRNSIGKPIEQLLNG